MASTLKSALIEASNPSTSPKRLRELSLMRPKNERNQLRQVIAANPNSEEDLLLELAADHPKQVIGNPRFKLLELSGEAWWDQCGLPSLFALLGTGMTPMNGPIEAVLLEGFNTFLRELTSDVKGEVVWAQELTVDLRDCANSSGMPAEILLRLAMVPFPGYFLFTKGDPCESLTNCIELLWQLGVGGEHGLSPFSDWPAGWNLEMVGTGSGGAWRIDAISQMPDGFDYSLEFPSLTILGPGGIEDQLELSEGEIDEEWRITAFDKEFESLIGDSSRLQRILDAV
jgi:hypothetical protein